MKLLPQIFLVSFISITASLPLAATQVTNDHNELNITGSISINSRYFPEPAAWASQLEGNQISISAEPELNWLACNQDCKIQVMPSLRLDSRDNDRNKFDLKEAYLKYSDNDLHLTLGINQVFWGVTESRHLVNIINQIDAHEDVTEESFLGQFMLQANKQLDIGEFSFIIMTGFRERALPESQGRLRSNVTTINHARYQSNSEQWRPELALRYSHFIGDFDLGVHYFNGINREPSILYANNEYTAFYSNINQLGLDLQYTDEALLLKFEGILREGQGKTFSAYVAGFEYTFYQLKDSDIDVGLLIEKLKDHRDKSVYPTVFNNDIFIGSRIALNDFDNTSALIGAYVDRDKGLSTVRAEFESRISESWKLTIEGQWFIEEDPQEVVSAYKNDSFINIELSYYF
ncbi:hypothetical protein tinsulaeT_32670 [Thalassotalea insulae]|uniref:Porin n=1 Tax=Thalassotalea insulae TaxID=2056778 RepID=A0ABQ6GX54_9GAMM|nr:hypothetical protein [Thalassotalea insulae]GLX79927.1 hypothetical protein tinsulaeT_32670 [Thalassotalea insulae]